MSDTPKPCWKLLGVNTYPLNGNTYTEIVLRARKHVGRCIYLPEFTTEFERLTEKNLGVYLNGGLLPKEFSYTIEDNLLIFDGGLKKGNVVMLTYCLGETEEEKCWCAA